MKTFEWWPNEWWRERQWLWWQDRPNDEQTMKRALEQTSDKAIGVNDEQLDYRKHERNARDRTQTKEWRKRRAEGQNHDEWESDWLPWFGSAIETSCGSWPVNIKTDVESRGRKRNTAGKKRSLGKRRKRVKTEEEQGEEQDEEKDEEEDGGGNEKKWNEKSKEEQNKWESNEDAINWKINCKSNYILSERRKEWRRREDKVTNEKRRGEKGTKEKESEQGKKNKWKCK